MAAKIHLRLILPVALVCAGSTAPVAVAAPATTSQQSEAVGMWSVANGWDTDQFGQGAEGYCVTESEPQSINGVTYRVFMTFGARNEVGLSTNSPVQRARDGIFDVEGGGLDLGDLHSRTEGGKFLVFNSITRPMFRLLIDDVRSAHSVRLQLGGKSFAAPIADPDALYSQMIECQESLLGLVIGELK